MEEKEVRYPMSMNSVFLVVVFLCSCQHANKKVENLGVEENHKDSTLFIPELSVNRLELRNSISWNNQFKNIKLIGEIRESYVAIFTNQNQEEYLIASQYEGDESNSFSSFEIGYGENDSIAVKRGRMTDYKNFKTESGLKLGLSENDIVRLKGNNYATEHIQNTKILKYNIDELSSPFLEKFAMPSYFMNFYLRHDKVFKICFGFGYP